MQAWVGFHVISGRDWRGEGRGERETYYGRRQRGHLYRASFLLQTPQSFIFGEAGGASAGGEGSLSSPCAIGALDGSGVWTSRSWIDIAGQGRAVVVE
jgi:hypothetical protein